MNGYAPEIMAKTGWACSGICTFDESEAAQKAREHPEFKFYVTRIACSIAGFRPTEIASLFKDAIAMENVILPKDFVENQKNKRKVI